jgi:hypothetical protein
MSLGTAKITIQLDSISVSTQTGNVSELGKLPEACAVAIANAIKMLEPIALKSELAKALATIGGLEARVAEMSKPIVAEVAPKKSRKYSTEE